MQRVARMCRHSRPHTAGRLLSGCENETPVFTAGLVVFVVAAAATSSSSIHRWPGACRLLLHALQRPEPWTSSHLVHHTAGRVIARGRWKLVEEGRNLALRVDRLVAAGRRSSEVTVSLALCSLGPAASRPHAVDVLGQAHRPAGR
jgi:hypothetical protein